MNTYRHYGSNKFIYERFKDVVDRPIRETGKPNGLWASPIDSELSWYNWCMGENFHTEHLNEYFDFTIREDSRILNIYEEDDIIPYIIKHKYNMDFGLYVQGYDRPKTDCADRYNIERLHEEFDGIELHLDQNYMNLRYTIFYSWDVDSIVIWNPDIIIPLEQKERNLR